MMLIWELLLWTQNGCFQIYSRMKTDKPASDTIKSWHKNPVMIHESSGGSAQVLIYAKKMFGGWGFATYRPKLRG